VSQLILDKSYFLSKHNKESSAENDLAKREHSRKIDRDLGFNINAIEAKLINTAKAKCHGGHYYQWGPAIHDGAQTWVGLDFQTLQLTYADLIGIITEHQLTKAQHVVDLGAAYGRLGIALSVIAPNVKFTGVEYVNERVDEGNRIYKNLNLKNCTLEVGDLNSDKFVLPEADVYYLYDFGNDQQISVFLKRLSAAFHEKKFRLIARGHMSRDLIKKHHPYFLYEN
jgi:tRNA A58 N-methylase Trm61